LIIAGPVLSQPGFTDWVEDFYYSFTAGPTPALKQTNYVDINGNHIPYMALSYFGVGLGAATVSGVHPGTGTDKTNTAVHETWQTIPLAAGWVTLAGQPAPSYRMHAQDNEIEIVGALQWTGGGNVPGGQQINSVAIPTGYRPATLQFVPRNPGAGGMSVSTAGIIQATLDPGQATVFVNVNGKYPINL
jgi:hypothetical protein